MAVPHQNMQLQYHYQSQQESKPLRNLLNVDGQNSSPISLDGSNRQYAALPFHVVGFAPGPVPVPVPDPNKRNPLKEEDFLEINTTPHIHSLDFFQNRSVSTGLALSLDDTRIASSADSPIFSILDDDVSRELQRQEAEMDRFIKAQGEQLRHAILKKVQASQLQILTLAEEKAVQKLRQKETEVEEINKKNSDLVERMKQLSAEAGVWQQQAKYNENMINALKLKLQQVYVQNRDNKEGCGDSEVDDTASCCIGGAIEFQMVHKESNGLKELMTCKACKVNELSILLLPCRHLCLCKECESKLSFCPICQSSKFIGMEVYM